MAKTKELKKSPFMGQKVKKRHVGFGKELVLPCDRLSLSKREFLSLS